MNITIIGMPGSGKSCMARALSSKLKMKNIDGDKLIKKVTKRELQDIINEDGLEEFKKIDPSAVKSKKESSYGIEAIVERNAVPTNVEITPVGVEELFVVLIKEEK